MSGQSLLTKSTFWLILAALTLPVGLSAWAENDDGGKQQPKLGGPRAGDGEQGGQRRGFGGERGPGGPDAGQRDGNPFGQLIAELNLTEEQQAKVRDVMQAQREKSQANREKNKAEIEKIDAQIKELMTKRRELMGGGPEEALQSLRGILTADQQATLDKKIEQFKQRREQGMRGGPDGDRPFRGGNDGGDGDRPRQRPNRGGNQGGNSGGGNNSTGEMLDL